MSEREEKIPLLEQLPKPLADKMIELVYPQSSKLYGRVNQIVEDRGSDQITPADVISVFEELICTPAIKERRGKNLKSLFDQSRDLIEQSLAEYLPEVIDPGNMKENKLNEWRKSIIASVKFQL